jgi:hypothetical protein
MTDHIDEGGDALGIGDLNQVLDDAFDAPERCDTVEDNPATRMALAEAARMAEALVFASAEPVTEKALAERLPDGRVAVPARPVRLREVDASAHPLGRRRRAPDCRLGLARRRLHLGFAPP